MAAFDPQGIRRARHIEASYFDSTRGFADSAALRLEALKGDLVAYLAGNRKMSQYAELLLVPGEPPRLWVDLLTSVVMEPNYRTYRIQQDLGEEPTIVLETVQREEVLRFLRAYISEKAALKPADHAPAAMESASAGSSAAWSTGFLVYAWLTGLVLGLLIVLIAVNMLK